MKIIAALALADLIVSGECCAFADSAAAAAFFELTLSALGRIAPLPRSGSDAIHAGDRQVI
jgi:hypothetical protein